jgi:hypothetical protein
MQLDPDGAHRFPAAFASSEVAALQALFANLPRDRPGARLGATPGLAALIGPADTIATSILGPAARPVRAMLFDKTPQRNWALGWHQDRTIAVCERRDAPGFTGWTVKAGIPHCVPPFDLLGRMLTLRIHLDPVGEANAPLLVSAGSHRERFAEHDIEAELSRRGSFVCLAEAGDVWAFATPILHASARAREPARRRVLQILYSADPLPGRLAWLGV